MKDKDNVDKMFIEKLNDIVQMQTKPIMLAEKEHLEYKNRIRAKLDKYVNVSKYIIIINKKLKENWFKERGMDLEVGGVCDWDS